MILNLKKIEYFNYKTFMYKKIKNFHYLFNYNRLKFDLIRSKYCLFFFLGSYKNLSIFKNMISFYKLDSKKSLNFFYCNDSSFKIGAFTNKFNIIQFMIQGLDSMALGVCIPVAKIKINFVNFGFLLKLITEVENFFFVKVIFKMFLVFIK